MLLVSVFSSKSGNNGSIMWPYGCINFICSEILNCQYFADLFEPCLVPASLTRDTEPCARSISWSQQGFGPNFGYIHISLSFNFKWYSIIHDLLEL